MFDFFNDITFANKELRWLFLVIPVIIVWYIFKYKNLNAELKTSSLTGFSGLKSSWKQHVRHLLIVLRLAILSLLILVLMRPQSRSSFKDVKTEGIDIVIALDISSSMLAKDFKPNRLDAAKELAVQFIDSRPNDRIGLVIFGGESFTQCPLTSDHAVIKNLFSEIKLGMLLDGTAIGSTTGIALWIY